MANDVIPLFMKIGLTEQRAKETAKNEALSQTLKEVILQVRLLRAICGAAQSVRCVAQFRNRTWTICIPNLNLTITLTLIVTLVLTLPKLRSFTKCTQDATECRFRKRL